MIKITFLILAIFSISVFAQDKWDIANKNVVRLKPNEFSQLPKSIIKNLEKRGCTIPQSFSVNENSVNEKHNVIQGEFRKKGQKDWAILCSINKTSSILVYWNGLIKNVSSIASTEDRVFLQGIGEDKIGFSRVIDVADAKYIYEHYENYGGIKPPKIEYQGINDIFAEKASTVLYFHKGKWLELQGAD